MLVTVFTPLFNREHSIKAVYESLCRQTCKDFEWFVINDGSTDASCKIMDEIVANHDQSFPIRYVFRENLGLMATLNEGISAAKGELFMRLDSDDSALPDAIKLISENYSKIKDDPKVCALVFRAVDYKNVLVGTHPFERPEISDFASFRDFYSAEGDRSEIMKVEIYRKYPFPMIEGEKFCPEGLVWNRIASQYNALYMTEAIYKKGMPDDSITAHVYHYLKKNSKGTTLYYREIVSSSRFSVKYRLLNAIKFYRYVFFSGENPFSGIPLFYAMVGLPLGLLVVLYDRIKH